MTIPTPPVDGVVKAPGGTRIRYRDHGGEGRGLVLLHRGGANLVSMDQHCDRDSDVVRMVLTHLAPAWDAVDEVVDVAEPFRSREPGS